MDNLLTVAFEAHHAEKNRHRRYRLTLGRDLFDNAAGFEEAVWSNTKNGWLLT